MRQSAVDEDVDGYAATTSGVYRRLILAERSNLEPRYTPLPVERRDKAELLPYKSRPGLLVLCPALHLGP